MENVELAKHAEMEHQRPRAGTNSSLRVKPIPVWFAISQNANASALFCAVQNHLAKYE